MHHGDLRLGEHLRPSQLLALAHAPTVLTLPAHVRTRLQACRTALLHTAATRPVYGVNTGFGALCQVPIPAQEQRTLQVNLLRSHAAGVGPVLDARTTRACLIVRAHALALGPSGVSPELIEAVLALVAHDLLPVVPSRGSVGASGDLAPLAHLALPLIGEGWVQRAGQTVPAADALAGAGLVPFALGPKEGLSLINGTQVTTTLGTLALWDSFELLVAANVVGALTLDASLGSLVAFDPRIAGAKPHAGLAHAAATIRALAEGSPLQRTHADCGEVQDAYSLRCMPQVHGAAHDALRYAASVLEIELNSASDNPLVFAGEGVADHVLSGGNFHAASPALVLDHVSAALTMVATMSERRVDRLMNSKTSRGLPPFLADRPGLESGFMMWHVTAAALASECKTLAVPACIDTIPTSAGQEDHVSMGPGAAHKLAAIVANVQRMLAIEAMVATRALQLRNAATTPRLARVAEAIRDVVGPLDGDRERARDVAELAHAVGTGTLREAAGLSHPWMGDEAQSG